MLGVNGVQTPTSEGLLPLAPSAGLLQKDFAVLDDLTLFGKLAHTHHFTVFYCEIGVVEK